VALMGYAALSIVAWLEMGRPNPLGLGYLSKALEIGLILAAAAHARMVLRTRPVSPTSSPLLSSLPSDESQTPQGAKT
jgi:hypothetical protein